MHFISYSLLIFAIGFGGACFFLVPMYRARIKTLEWSADFIQRRHRAACETIVEQKVTISRLQVEAASDFVALTHLRWSRDWWRAHAKPSPSNSLN